MADRIGTNQADTLTGTSEDDFLRGRGGDDLLFGLGGDDLFWGGNGNDRAEGGPGNDTLYGGDGEDHLLGGPDTDNLYGQAGNDTLWGGGGWDTLRGNAGDDELRGGEGADRFVFYAEDFVSYVAGEGSTADYESDYILDFDADGGDTLSLPVSGILASETLSDGRVRVFLESSAVFQSDDPFGPDSPFDFDGGGLFG